jgi:hypothetical protein
MTVKDDSGLTRVRKVRHEISAEFDHDPDRLIDCLIKSQERHKERLLIIQEGPETPQRAAS